MYNSGNIPRRPVNYVPNSSNIPNTSESLSSKKFSNHRPLRVYVGDMVQVIDQRSEVFKKFGLVEQISPHNQEWQVLIKIGRTTYPVFFSQLKFCTRISTSAISDGQEDFIPGVRSNHGKIYKESNVSDFIDPIDTIDEDDNIGNREGANEKH